MDNIGKIEYFLLHAYDHSGALLEFSSIFFSFNLSLVNKLLCHFPSTLYNLSLTEYHALTAWIFFIKDNIHSSANPARRSVMNAHDILLPDFLHKTLGHDGLYIRTASHGTINSKCTLLILFDSFVHSPESHKTAMDHRPLKCWHIREKMCPIPYQDGRSRKAQISHMLMAHWMTHVEPWWAPTREYAAALTRETFGA